MKIRHLKTLAITLSLFVFTSANAHDPSKHKKDAEKPKCEAMAEMDHSKMKSDDPVMQAMMEKCKTTPIDKMEDKETLGNHAEESETETNTGDDHSDESQSDHHD